MSEAYVIDASVAIKLFVDEEDSDAARELLYGLAKEEPDQFHIPSLCYLECANVLWKYVRRYGYDRDVARSHLNDLRDLAFRVVTTDELMEPAFDLAVTYDITVYDACYVALAEAVGCPLVTTDQKLIAKISQSDVSAQLVGDLQRRT